MFLDRERVHTMADDIRSEQVVHDLIDVCEDGEQGFRRCAERVQRPELKQLFESRARECRDAADALAQLVGERASRPGEGGSVAGALHRGWVAVKDAVAADDELAVLQECERGEDHALHRYQEAMQAPLPPTVREVVASQYEGVRRNHDQVRALRDRARAERQGRGGTA
jgi:uncharacterized protein (TIGR02284 family)